jgi:outer membrane lipoprotein carrier protein
MLEKLMNKRSVHVLRVALLFVSLLAASTDAAERQEDAELVVEKLQKRYESTQDFVAVFQQETEIRSLNRRTRGRGKLYFKRPGKMLWRYEEPRGQWVLADGKSFYYYQPEQGQVLKSPLRNAWNSEIPLSFLLGLGSLKRDFRATLKGSGGEEYQLQLLPKTDQGRIGQLLLGVDARSFDIRWAQVVDPVGNITTIRFSGLQRDGGLKDSLFHVEIPKGAEVVELGS